jgi:hypothetical protein
MDGTTWLLLWALALGFIAGCRHGTGRSSSGLALAIGIAENQPKPASRHKATDPVCRQSLSVDSARPSGHAGRAHYFRLRNFREILEAAPLLYIDAGGAKDPAHPGAALTGYSARD